MSPRRVSPPSASDAVIAPPPDAAVARFRNEVARLVARACDGASPRDDARLALAVSGGADSMAMLALAVAAFPARVVAATVDHGLRADAAAEARMVVRCCATLGVPHETLVPAEPIAGSSIQMRAREARYSVLTRWADRQGALALLTAHHADDQAETLLMRLNRASGLSGVAAIRAYRWEAGTLVLRPLLDWRRAELRAIAQGCALPFVDDPTNADPRHDRTRIRALLAEAPDLDPVALARSAAFLAEAEDMIAHQAAAAWEERWRGPERAFRVEDLPRELRRRLLRRAIHAARAHHAITLPGFTESANVEPLLDALEAGQGAVKGGVQVIPGERGWNFRPAPARRSL